MNENALNIIEMLNKSDQNSIALKDDLTYARECISFI